MEEIEVKFADVDVAQLKEKLTAIGAQFVGEFLYKRKNYDFPDMRLAKENAWVRVRDEGSRTVMTFKQRFGVGDNQLKDGGMKEIEIVVDNFQKADELLTAIGLVAKFYEENKRTRYVRNDVEFDIDVWPLIPPYLEIEGKDWDSVEAAAKELEFDWKDHLRCSTMQIYADNGIDENDYSVLTFEKQIKK